MEKFKYKIILDNKGSLLPISFKNNFNFKVKRDFLISGRNKTIRGNHAHKKCIQALVVLKGKSIIEVKDKKKIEKIHLSSKNKFGIIVKPKKWLKIKFSTKDNLILVFCSEEYDTKDYIYNFKNL